MPSEGTGGRSRWSKYLEHSLLVSSIIRESDFLLHLFLLHLVILEFVTLGVADFANTKSMGNLNVHYTHKEY